MCNILEFLDAYSLLYVHVPDNKRRKLDGKSIRCVLLGLGEESKAYKLYNSRIKR